MTANTNPLSYNAYIEQMGVLAVYTTLETTGVFAFIDAPPQLSVPAMLNYAELRIQRDLDLLSTRTNNAYAFTAGNQVFALPVDDFLIVETVKVRELTSPAPYYPLVPVSLEYIQNVYGAASTPGVPRYFCMYGDTFGDGGDTNTNIVVGPIPNSNYPFVVNGVARAPSLNKYAAAGIADTSYTYISSYLPDMLLMASMIYITMVQRNFGAVGDTPEMGMTYEKQYQILRLGAIAEENRRKQMGSAWSGYSTPTSATTTR